uniref:Phage protein, HK97 gp10 family n=1 Tax=Methanococcus maripaludis (strain C6 / ATCC BAA-1332) TaxID=444158 RepID=A9A7H4_METM6
MVKISIVPLELPDVEQIIAELDQAMVEGLTEAGTLAQNVVMDTIQNYYVKGSGYKGLSEKYKKRLQRKGRWPHRGLISDRDDHPKLIDNIDLNYRRGVFGKLYIFELSVGVQHGIYLEKGTSKIQKRPFFYMPLARAENRMLRKFTDAISRVLEKYN